jgi:hypothetical protein
MPVFSRFNPRAAGGVLRQAHPNADPYPWIPLQTTTRTDTQWGGQARVHRVQPHERGKTFTSTPLSGNGGGAAPTMSGGCAGCGGCNKGSAAVGMGVNKRP